MKKNRKTKLWGMVQHVPRSKKEEREFGKAKKEFIMCPVGKEIYYDKSWHHSLEDWKHLKLARPGHSGGEDKNIKFRLCPAHQMIKDKKWEGEVVIEGTPLRKKAEMIKLIENIGKRAYERDPMDRIINIKTKSEKLKTKEEIFNFNITTTENQLALSVAKEVASAFRDLKFKKEIKWSHNEDFVRIKLIPLF